jgi:hypothetical protein
MKKDLKRIYHNLPAILSGAFLGGLFFYWLFWGLGVVSQYDIQLIVQPREVSVCSQSTSTSLP